MFLSSPWYWLSEDTDGRVTVLGTRYCINKLELPIKTTWRPWHHKKQVKMIAFKNLLIVISSYSKTYFGSVIRSVLVYDC